MTTMLKLVGPDNGNCRIYYKDGRKLRCFQEDQRDVFTLYVCSSDGEPEYELYPSAMQLDGMPDDDCSTSRAFRKWWEAR